MDDDVVAKIWNAWNMFRQLTFLFDTFFLISWKMWCEIDAKKLSRVNHLCRIEADRENESKEYNRGTAA